MRIATHNVNGIRAAQRRGIAGWRDERMPSVIALQEVRCAPDQLPLEAFGDYHVAYDPGTLAGRNGVAVLTREPVAAVRAWGPHALSWAPGQVPVLAEVTEDVTLARELRGFVAEGRYLEVDLASAPLTIASVYVPKGDSPLAPRDPATARGAQLRYERKMAFLAGFARQLKRARLAAAARGREYLVMGDFNIAHTRYDVRNWRGNQKSAGFLPEEREWFASIVSPRTLVDVMRRLHPDADGPYSWWSWRGKAFDSDTGWRIDYQLATPRLAKLATTGGTDKEPSYEARISDHAPVVIDYQI
ncbi:exodeoxyribonuclease III [Brooklawnia sp.]|uniref:exodeoxyribonuclease III n=1 Tax=Brooklawnia sp. TaxID=2699740 RepID=UPI00311E6AC5